jgi:hypothetical protein
MERSGSATWPVQPRASGRALREPAEIQWSRGAASDIDGQTETSKWAGAHESIWKRASFDGASGTSDIEGKAARLAASECGQRASFKSQHPADICACSCGSGTLCLRRGYSPLFVGRATFPPIASPTRSTEFTRRGGQTSGATKIALFPLFPFSFCLVPSAFPYAARGQSIGDARRAGTALAAMRRTSQMSPAAEIIPR